MGYTGLFGLYEIRSEFYPSPDIGGGLDGFLKGIPVGQAQGQSYAQEVTGRNNVVGIPGCFQGNTELLLFARGQVYPGIHDRIGTVGGGEDNGGLLPGPHLVKPVQRPDIIILC